MLEARAARDMGTVCRAYRYHPSHLSRAGKPMHQRVVAELIGISQVQVSRIEKGICSVENLDKLVHWAQTLGMPAWYAWFELPGQDVGERDFDEEQIRDAKPKRSSVGGAASTAEEDEVKRRTALGVPFAVATAIRLPSRRGASFQPMDPAPASAPTTPVTPVDVSELVSVMLSPQPPAGRNEPRPVEQLAKQVTAAWHLRQRADYNGLGRLLPRLLVEAQAQCNAATNAADRAGRVVVHAYNAASSLLRTLGDEPTALVAADRAVAAARLLDDPILVAAALYRMANVVLSSRRPAQAKEVALRAADLVEPGKLVTPRSLAVWGGLLLTAAVAAARTEDEGAAWELMGEARAASRLRGAEHTDIYAIFGPTNVAVHGVQVAVELRNGRDAIRRAESVDTSHLPPGLVERRGQLLIDISHGYALERNDANAITVLRQARRLAPQEVAFNPAVRQIVSTVLSRARGATAAQARDFAALVGC